MNESHYHRAKVSAGFTLLELLVSSAVLAIVLVILLGTMTASLGLWRNSDSAAAADREGRSANSLLYHDLRSAYVPRNKPELWPTIQSDGTYLAFLTRKSSDYQNTAAGDVGEICFVEYLVESNALKRRFVGSKETYQALLADRFPSAGTNPFQVLATNIIPAEAAMRRTLVGRTPADLEAITPNFMPVSRGWIVDTNTTTFTNQPNLLPGEVAEIDGRPFQVLELVSTFLTNVVGGVTNVTVRIDAVCKLMQFEPAFERTRPGSLPQAIEVNLPAADMDTLANRDLLANPDFLLRSPGFFHFRVTLFPSP